MAGGPKALASAVEVNEDSEELGQRDIARRPSHAQKMSSSASLPRAALLTWSRLLPMPVPAERIPPR